jgi:L-arabinokinase
VDTIRRGPDPLHIAFYPSAHGFGHASRDLEVVRALHRLAPAVRISLRTGVADWLLASELDGIPCEITPARLDVGVVQPSGVRQDVSATLRACQELLARRPALLDGERRFLAEREVDLAVSDIAAIPLAAARSEGVKALAMSNFTWSWIYRELAEVEPGLGEVAIAFAADYARAHAMLRLPFHGPCDEFAAVEDVPMIARHGRHPREETLAALGIKPDRPCILVTFGGLGPGAIDIEALRRMERYRFILTPPSPPAVGSNLHAIENRDLARAGLRYPDLVAACDVAVSKPGYGIVSECLANATRLLYTSRGQFAEYPLLVDAIENHGVGRFISPEDLAAGRWGGPLDALLARPRRPCPLASDGAEVVARRLLAG